MLVGSIKSIVVLWRSLKWVFFFLETNIGEPQTASLTKLQTLSLDATTLSDQPSKALRAERNSQPPQCSPW